LPLAGVLALLPLPALALGVTWHCAPSQRLHCTSAGNCETQQPDIDTLSFSPKDGSLEFCRFDICFQGIVELAREGSPDWNTLGVAMVEKLPLTRHYRRRALFASFEVNERRRRDRARLAEGHGLRRAASRRARAEACSSMRSFPCPILGRFRRALTMVAGFARTHQFLDDRSLARHRLVAQKIRRQPELFKLALTALARWRRTADPASLPYLDSWQSILDQGAEAALAVALERSERGNALRQCSPFVGILTRSERRAFFRQWRDDSPAA
jgi:hypothetical protein